MRKFKIGSRKIGDNYLPLIIAEIGINHFGSLKQAKKIVLAAKKAKIICVDGVYNAFKDDVGLKNEAEHGRDLGFDGKTLIHPAQIAISNKTYTPSFDDKELYTRQIEAFDEAVKNGKGVAVLDGNIVENLHVEIAKRNLALMWAIEDLEEN